MMYQLGNPAQWRILVNSRSGVGGLDSGFSFNSGGERLAGRKGTYLKIKGRGEAAYYPS